MNELRDELRSLADRVDLPPTTAAEGAWAAARGRVRRRRAAAAAGVAAAVVVAAVGLQAVTAGPDDVQPAPLPPTSDSLLDVASPVVGGERLDPLLGEALAGWSVDREVVPLAQDPLDGPAAYAVGVGKREVRVLGQDGRYRSITTSLQTISNGGQPLRSGSLSPDATLLALPQPDGLVVVDLAAGEQVLVRLGSGSLAVTEVAWIDEDTVAVWAASALVRTLEVTAGSTASEMEDSVTEVPGGGLPAAAASDTAWFPDVAGLTVDGEEVEVPSVRAQRGAGPVPVAGDGWVAVAAEPAEVSELPRGIAVLDTATGRPRAFLPVRALDFFAQGSGGAIVETVVAPPPVAPLAVEGPTTVVVSMQTTYGVLVLSWDWATDDLTGLVAEDTGGLPGGTAISWGVGLP